MKIVFLHPKFESYTVTVHTGVAKAFTVKLVLKIFFSALSTFSQCGCEGVQGRLLNKEFEGELVFLCNAVLR